MNTVYSIIILSIASYNVVILKKYIFKPLYNEIELKNNYTIIYYKKNYSSMFFYFVVK